MTRFVFLSIFFLGWAFYEVSGGKDFEPAPPERLAKSDPVDPPATREAALKGEGAVDISAALAAESRPVTDSVPIALVSAPAPTPSEERVALIPSQEELEAVAIVEDAAADIREGAWKPGQYALGAGNAL